MTEESQVPLIKITSEKVDLRKKEQPLVDLKITNPVTYIKSWWKRIIGNEGIDIRFRVRPLTAIVITIIVVTVTMGIGKFVLPFEVPFFVYNDPVPTPQASSQPTPIPWRETAFSGELRYAASTGKYYLFTANAEAINLEVPRSIDIQKVVGRRIFATGQFSESQRALLVSSVEDLEILPQKTEPIPTITPTTAPSQSPEPTEDQPHL